MAGRLIRFEIIKAALAEASLQKSAPSSQALWDATGGVSAPAVVPDEIAAPGLLFLTASA